MLETAFLGIADEWIKLSSVHLLESGSGFELNIYQGQHLIIRQGVLNAFKDTARSMSYRSDDGTLRRGIRGVALLHRPRRIMAPALTLFLPGQLCCLQYFACVSDRCIVK